MDLLQMLWSGIVLGLIYAIVAYGYQITFSASKSLNFGQGEALMLGGLLAFTLVPYLTWWGAIPIILLAGAIQGIIVERLAVNKPLAKGSESGWIMGTLALGIIFKSLAEVIWGTDELAVASPVGDTPFTVFGLIVQPMEILILGSVLSMMVGLGLFLKRSRWGKALEAVSQDRDTSQLMGINAGWVVASAFALSCALAGFAGLLIAPLTATGATMGVMLGIKGFAAAVVGGLSSPRGAVLGGLIIGTLEALTAYYGASGWKEVPGLVLLLVMLALKPGGLMGKTIIKKV
jgi:branched-chain amino acid transport system permease protein